MAIGACLMMAAVACVVARRATAPAGRRVYAALALPLVLIGLLIFVAVSQWAGVPLLALGQARRYGLPADYLAAGVAGWATMLVAVLGALSPVGAAIAAGHGIGRDRIGCDA